MPADRVITYPADAESRLIDRLMDDRPYMDEEDAAELAHDVVIDLTEAVDKLRASESPAIAEALKALQEGEAPAPDRIRAEAARLAHVVLAFDAAPLADKPTYRGELIEQARNLAEAVTEAVARGV